MASSPWLERDAHSIGGGRVGQILKPAHGWQAGRDLTRSPKIAKANGPAAFSGEAALGLGPRVDAGSP
jgi:hypothetical protein